MIRIAKIIQTCDACPSQWSAQTPEGQYVYIRFRWGRLLAYLDDTCIFDVRHGDTLNGYLEFEQLQELTAGVLDFSEARWVEKQDEIEPGPDLYTGEES